MSLYVWGSNKFKQLNHLRELHSYAPTYIPSTCGDNVPTAVAAGESHTLVLCESGDIYSFGRGKEGQLGHSDVECSEAKIVDGLGEETIIDIAAGSLTSYAVTSTGNVYHWGLVYRKMRAGAEATDHGLHGLAQDQDTFYVEADMEARAQEQEAAMTGAEAGALETAPAAYNNLTTPPATEAAAQQVVGRQLRDIVRDSTEQWQLPTTEADAEYLEELRVIGFQPEQLKARMAMRAREYQQMLAEGCTRAQQGVPERIPNLGHIRVRAVSAGYAHVMLLSDEGRLYGAGYNDRGQLGLGHRINTSEFKPLDFLGNKFVLQVACGQQHSICRAVDRSQLPLLHERGVEVVVGCDCGADAYVWGNGTLGQLGLGMKGTTKGRLYPTRNATLHDLYPLGIVDVAAGANFTAAVTHSGRVYSFGHSEYNQHGENVRSNSDYVDAHFYFLPRAVEIKTPDATSTPTPPKGHWTTSVGSRHAIKRAVRDVHIKRICCGASFTVAIDDRGDLYSWGWNESGVLGHGVRHFASVPQRVEVLGASYDGCKVRAVSAGGKHVVALTESQGHAWAASFHSILESGRHVDCVIEIQDAVAALASKFAPGKKNFTAGAAGGGRQQTSFPCHRAILSARSTFLRGYINAALRRQRQEQSADGSVDTEGNDVLSSSSSSILYLRLPSSHANAVTVRSLLDYLYLDRLQVASHKREELRQLAADLRLERLRHLVEAAATAATATNSNKKHALPSVFTANLTQLLNSPEHADVVFVFPKVVHVSPLRDTAVGAGEQALPQEKANISPSAGAGAGVDDVVKVFDASDYDFVLYAHRAVIGTRLPYFEAMLTSGFVESQRKVRVCAPFEGSQTVATLIDVSGLLAEGIDQAVLEMVLLYAYTGQFRNPKAGEPEKGVEKGEEEVEEEVDLNVIMGVLVAASRLGFTSLMQHCERLLSLHLGDYFPHNATNCLEFAAAYNIPRLERQCREILRKTTSSVAVGATAVAPVAAAVEGKGSV